MSPELRRTIDEYKASVNALAHRDAQLAGYCRWARNAAFLCLTWNAVGFLRYLILGRWWAAGFSFVAVVVSFVAAGTFEGSAQGFMQVRQAILEKKDATLDGLEDLFRE